MQYSFNTLRTFTATSQMTFRFFYFPVGSAHTVLAAYWSEKLGKKKMLGNKAESSLIFQQQDTFHTHLLSL